MKIFDVVLDTEKMIVHMGYVYSEPLGLRVVISDIEMDCPYMVWNGEFEPYQGYWTAPLSARLSDVVKFNPKFKGFLFKVYTSEGRLLQSTKLPTTSQYITPSKFHTDAFDITGHSYVDFFYSKLCDGIDRSGIVVDAGANVGMFTLLCKDDAKRIYALEPDTFPFHYLQKNFGDTSNVILLNKALSVNCAPIDFIFSLVGSVGSGETSLFENKINCTVDAINVQTILDIEGHINLLKLDIEGTEFKVMEELTEAQLARVSQLFIEFHANSEPIKTKLINCGFNVEYRHSAETDSIGFIYAYKL